MKRMRQAGFTLIELVVVIVILGILAAVAVPQFIDTSASAKTAAAQAGCSAVASQAVLLYASTKAPNSFASIRDSLQTQNLTIAAGSCSTFTATASGTTVNCPTLPSGLCN